MGHNKTLWNLNLEAHFAGNGTFVTNCETVHLRLELEPTCRDSNRAKTHGLLTEITYLISGLNEAQVLDVSLQKEFGERQSDR